MFTQNYLSPAQTGDLTQPLQNSFFFCMPPMGVLLDHPHYYYPIPPHAHYPFHPKALPPTLFSYFPMTPSHLPPSPHPAQPYQLQASSPDFNPFTPSESGASETTSSELSVSPPTLSESSSLEMTSETESSTSEVQQLSSSSSSETIGPDLLVQRLLNSTPKTIMTGAPSFPESTLSSPPSQKPIPTGNFVVRRPPQSSIVDPSLTPLTVVPKTIRRVIIGPEIRNGLVCCRKDLINQNAILDHRVSLKVLKQIRAFVLTGICPTLSFVENFL